MSGVGGSSRAARTERGPLVWFLIIAAWYAATAWARPLLLPDEGRYVGVALEMLQSGDWLTPKLDGLPFFHKPPLFYWISAAGMGAFGVHEWAARLAPVLGATVGSLALFLFVRRWFDARTAWGALLVLATSPLFFVGGQFANLDMLVAGFIAATILALAHAALCAEHGLPTRGTLAGAYVLAALGVLAKGLIGFVLPGLVIVVWLLAWRRPRLILTMLSLPGALLFLVVAAPWFVAMQQQYPDFLNYFFVVQHFKRFSGSGFNNVQPLWFYPVVLLVLALPWTLWLRGVFRGAYWRDTQRGPARLLMGLWLLLIVAFFSMPKSKLVGYVLPAVPPLAFLIADSARGLMAGAANPRTRLRLWRLSAIVAVLIGVGAVVYLTLRPPRSTQALAVALAAQQKPGEPVIFLNQYFYDVPFYAGLHKATWVVDDWDSPEVAKSDNWRKELADAARFATPDAAAALVTPAQLGPRLCAVPFAWVMAPRWALPKFTFMAGAVEVAGDPRSALWKVDTTLPATAMALACPGKPNADLPSK